MSETDIRVSDDVFSLDIGGFDTAIQLAESLATKMGDLKNDLDTAKCDLMFTWAGKGRNTFETKYRLLSQQFGDLEADMRDIAEDLKNKELEYIQADVELAKNLDGRDSRF